MKLVGISFAEFQACHLLLCIALALSFNQVSTTNETDRFVLLQFKAGIIKDPFGVLNSWNNSIGLCQWYGVTCGRRHRRVTVLDLSSQGLSGSISPHIGNLSFIRELLLQNNSFDHEIPPQVSQLRRLRILGLHNNSLIGEIPKNISECLDLVMLSLGNNQLIGEIPGDLGSLLKLQRLNLYANNLTGSVPSSIGNLSSLEILYLTRNNLGGSIPQVLGHLSNLHLLGIRFNRLSDAEMVAHVGDFGLAKFLDGLTNQMSSMARGTTGYIPPEYGMGCKASRKGDVYSYGILLLELFTGLSPTGHKFGDNLTLHNFVLEALPERVLEITDIFLLQEKEDSSCYLFYEREEIFRKCLVMVYKIGVACSSQVPQRRISISKVPHLLHQIRDELLAWVDMNKRFFLDDSYPKISYETLLKATRCFSSTNLIGVGGYGSVYKGILQANGRLVAVKVLHLAHQGALNSLMVECEVSKNIKQRNILKILTVCSSKDHQGNHFKALVYEYMANGSLKHWLHPCTTSSHGNEILKKLNFIRRINIAIDIAYALDYLHHQCPIPIVHCDLKPSNILLDAEMVAHVGDFGLAKFLDDLTNQMSSMARGTTGYIPPEYGMGCKASRKGDVYSYGILLLELFTGLSPTSHKFGDNLTLNNFVA